MTKNLVFKESTSKRSTNEYSYGGYIYRPGYRLVEIRMSYESSMYYEKIKD